MKEKKNIRERISDLYPETMHAVFGVCLFTLFAILAVLVPAAAITRAGYAIGKTGGIIFGLMLSIALYVLINLIVRRLWRRTIVDVLMDAAIDWEPYFAGVVMAVIIGIAIYLMCILWGI